MIWVILLGYTSLLTFANLGAAFNTRMPAGAAS